MMRLDYLSNMDGSACLNQRPPMEINPPLTQGIKSNKNIVYCTQINDGFDNAPSINSQRRLDVLISLGYNVVSIQPTKRVFANFNKLQKTLSPFSTLVIRIDGSGELDKYTLLKLYRPSCSVLWEIHGFPEERIVKHPTWKTLAKLFKERVKRWSLSFLCSGYIFISEDIESYSRRKIASKRSVVINNFIAHKDIRTSNAIMKDRFPCIFNNKDYFTVLWGGDAYYPWQGTDVLEKVANRIYATDKKIQFIFISNQYWHKPIYSKNILRISAMPYKAYLRAVYCADVCIALYHKPFIVPVYFSSMKILDYLLMKKPIIATKTDPIKQLIKHDETGYLTNNSIKNIINQILYIKKNPDVAKQVGRNGRRFVLVHASFAHAQELYCSFLTSL